VKLVGLELLLGAALAMICGCERYVAVGHEDALAVGDGGAHTAEPAGVDADLLWSAHHEAASFDEWLSDDAGIKYVERSGELELTTQRAHSGEHAFVATIAAPDGELHQAMMGRNIELAAGRYGAWYFLSEAPRTDGWVIMKLSNGSTTDRFDIDLDTPDEGAAYLRLYEHDQGFITEPAPISFPIEQWVHVEALYHSTPNNDGRLIVLQDGQPVLDTGPRPTASSDRVTFYCGSTSRHLAPAPYRLFIDDASIGQESFP
jgi:hypothetical protein